MENVRELLHQYNPNIQFFIGNHVISRKSVKNLVEKIFNNQKKPNNPKDSSIESILGKFQKFIKITLRESSRNLHFKWPFNEISNGFSKIVTHL